MKERQDFKSALIGKTVPLLVLDQKWHRLFAVHGKTDEIKELESKLNNLLAEQGRLNNRLKELKKLKGRLLDEIVQGMDDKEKKLEENKRLVDEINEKLDEAIPVPACVQMRMELTRRGRTESWIFSETQIRHSLEKYKKDADSLKLTMFPEFFGEDPDYGSMAEMIYENGQENWTIYPPVEDTGAYGFELLHRTLPAFDDAEKDQYASNPFTRDFTEFEVLSFDDIKEIPGYLNLFARAVHACGWDSVYTTSKGYNNFDYVCRSTVSADGMNLHGFLREQYAFHNPVIAIAEDLGAMIRIEGFHFLIGGTPEFMKQFRKNFNLDGRPFTCMTSNFVPGLDFYPADKAAFKRKLTAWVTASEKYPHGLYDILHAHHFSKNNRQFIGDSVNCGCFHCGRILPGSDITQWIDGGKTARCPHCGVDSLLPEDCGHPVTNEFLKQMNEYWFQTN